VTTAVRRDAAFNAHDIETALAGMSDDVAWHWGEYWWSVSIPP
jgi:hypothetical protein